MQQVFSPKQVARAIGASESSVKRWCDRGLLETVKTVGGHRRVALSGVLHFLREKNHALVVPEELGLPTEIGLARTSLQASKTEFNEALASGNYPVCRRILLEQFLAQHSIGSICDEVIVPAMQAMGDGWCNSTIEVFEERRGCDIAMRLLFELRSMISQPKGDAPLAIGASVEADPYSLPTRMVELSLIESGWNATSLGCGVPLSSLKKAIQSESPRLFWLSVSAIEDEEKFVEEYRDLFSACDKVAVVLGGRALHEELREKIQYTSYCENLQRLESLVKAIYSPKD